MLASAMTGRVFCALVSCQQDLASRWASPASQPYLGIPSPTPHCRVRIDLVFLFLSSPAIGSDVQLGSGIKAILSLVCPRRILPLIPSFPPSLHLSSFPSLSLLSFPFPPLLSFPFPPPLLPTPHLFPLPLSFPSPLPSPSSPEGRAGIS